MKNIRIEQAIQDFLDYLASLNRTPATLKTYRQVLGWFAKYAEAHHLVETTGQLSEALVEAWMKHLHEREIKGNTRRAWLTVLKSWSKYLAHKEYTRKDIAYPIAMPKAEKRKPVWVADDKIREALNLLLSDSHPCKDFYANLRDHVLIRLLYVTGMRIGEAMGVDPSKDIQWESQSIEILGKGRKQRTVYADGTTLQILRLYLEEQTKRMPNGHRLFSGPDGRPLSYETLKRIAKRHLGVTPHVLRHSYATNLRLRGMDLDALAELMGHESMETTRIYATLANEELRKRYMACGLLGGNGNGTGELPSPPTPTILPGGEAEVKRVVRKLGRRRAPR